ncbi:prolyl oligopeptidase family serine peptidase [Streptacidiphilus sp. 4-A2]|nr:prolyl oligopeptidase family serine peptidase [Streptacidiphilus sp. 4-A2]
MRAGRCAAIVRDEQARDTLLFTTRLGGLPVPQTDWATLYRAGPGEHLEDLVLSDRHLLVVVRQGGGQRLLRFETDAATSTGPAQVTFTEAPAPPESPAPPEALLSAVQLVPGVRPAGAAVEIVRAGWTAPSRWYGLDEGTLTAVPHTTPHGTRRLPGVDVLVLQATSADGTLVPLTLLRPTGHSGPLPTVLYAYGAYGLPVDPEYSVFRPSLFRRGVAFAVAHIRGGGELGPAWHQAGRGPGKLRAVEDYLACARLLTASGRAAPGALVARARSAGAAVVGAAVNRDPGLFRAGVLEVPFVDCLATLLQPDDPLAALEWDEWGNPIEDPAARAALAALSPVDNVAPGRYPALLLTGGSADVRVRATEPLRLAARIRRVTTSGRPVLVRIDGTGHLGHSDADDDLADEADVLAFILHETQAVDAEQRQPPREPGQREA